MISAVPHSMIAIGTGMEPDGTENVVMTLVAQNDGRIKLATFLFDRPSVETSSVYRRLPAEELSLAYFGAAPKVKSVIFV